MSVKREVISIVSNKPEDEKRERAVRKRKLFKQFLTHQSVKDEIHRLERINKDIYYEDSAFVSERTRGNDYIIGLLNEIAIEKFGSRSK